MKTILFILEVFIIIWIVDHIICRHKDSTRVWIFIDITLIFVFVMKWILTNCII